MILHHRRFSFIASTTALIRLSYPANGCTSLSHVSMTDSKIPPLIFFYIASHNSIWSRYDSARDLYSDVLCDAIAYFLFNFKGP